MDKNNNKNEKEESIGSCLEKSYRLRHKSFFNDMGGWHNPIKPP